MKPSDRLGYGWGMDRHKKPQERSRYTFPGANTLAITINRNKKRTLSYKTVQQNGYEKAVGVRLGYLPLEKMKKPLKIKGFHGGRNRTRTCDPIDVNDVLYQLSHATIAPVIGHLHLTTKCIISGDMRFVKRYFEEKLPRKNIARVIRNTLRPGFPPPPRPQGSAHRHTARRSGRG